MSIGAYSVSWRGFAASVATAAVFLSVAAAAWGVTPQTWTIGDIVQLAEPGEIINSVALSPDGKTLAVSFCTDETGKVGKGRVVFVDTTTKKVVKTLPLPEGLTGCVASLRFSPDGSKLIGAGGHKIFEWDKDGNLIGATPTPTGDTASIDINPVGGGPSTPTPSPSTSSRNTPTPTPTPARALDGGDGQVHLQDPNGQPVPGSPVPTPINNGNSPVKDMEFSEDGKTVVVVGNDGRTGKACVLTWDERQKKWVCPNATQTTMPSLPNDVDTSPVNPKEYAVGCFYGQVVIVVGGKKTVYKGHGDGAVCVEYLPNGDLAAGGWDGKIIIRDSKTKKVIAVIELGDKQIMHMVMSPDGLTIYVFDSDGKMTVIKKEPTPTPTPGTPGSYKTPTPAPNATTPSKTPAATPPKTSSTSDPELIDPVVSVSPTPDPSMVQVNSWPY